MARNLIIVSSLTGNTRQIGEALQHAFSDTVLLTSQEAAQEANAQLLEQAQNVAVGFWCGHGGMPQDISVLTEKLRNKRLGVFATLGGDPQSERAKAWLNEQAQVLCGLDRANTLVATFMCRGKIAPAVLAQMQKMPGWATPERQAKWAAAAEHPNTDDEVDAVAAMTALLA